MPSSTWQRTSYNLISIIHLLSRLYTHTDNERPSEENNIFSNFCADKTNIVSLIAYTLLVYQYEIACFVVLNPQRM